MGGPCDCDCELGNIQPQRIVPKYTTCPIRLSTTSKLPLLALSATAVTGVWVKVLSAFMRGRGTLVL